jgi:hypothetical protein
MASIHREVLIESRPEAVWDAVRDVGAVHIRVAPGFLTGCRMEDAPLARVVTFANGMEARELIVAEGAAHTRVVWIADLLPNELAPAIAGMIEQGLAAMKKTLER